MNQHTFNIGIILREIRRLASIESVEHAIDAFPFSEAEEFALSKGRELAIGGRSWESLGQQDQLANIFQFLEPGHVGIREEKNAESFIVPNTLNRKDSLFPGLKGKSWKDQLSDFVKAAGDWEKGNSESMLFLLEKYTSTLPIPVADLAGVSFYDHVKSVIAFSTCFLKNTGESQGNSIPFAALLGGDLSGIQSFIYDIVSKNAAKNLKGRSFYLELLTQSVIHFILKKMGLSMAQVIYSSGGGFYILVPLDEDFEIKFTAIKKEIENSIYKEHQTNLFLSINYVNLSAEELLSITEIEGEEKSGISHKWQELRELINTHKYSRFSNRLVENYKDYFLPKEEGGLQGRDSVTLEEFTVEEEKERLYLEADPNKIKGNKGTHIKFLNRDNPRDPDPVKAKTFSLIELGRELRDANYWVISRSAGLSNKDFNPCGLGIHHAFYQNLGKAELEKWKSIAEEVWVISINETTLHHEKVEAYNPKLTYGFCFYGGNQFPLAEDEENSSFPISTDELAAKYNAEGVDIAQFKRVGILRMDVDNLGQMFLSGFAENKKSFSRYTALSRSLDWFFKGYLNHLLEPWVEKKLAYILYAGGDDLFLLGRWDITVKIAQKIHGDFKKLHGANPYLSISGGVSFVTPKFPIMLAAEYASDAEKAAKAHTFRKKIGEPESEKNSFSLMNIPLNWDHEYSLVESLKTEFDEYVGKGEKAFPSSLRGKIREHVKSRKIQEKYKLTPRWYWMLVYDFSQIRKRMKKRQDQRGAAEAFLDRIKTRSVSDNQNPVSEKYSYLELLNLAARWSELEERTNQLGAE